MNTKTLLFVLLVLLVAVGAWFVITKKQTVVPGIVVETSCSTLLLKPATIPFTCTEELGNDAGTAVLTIESDRTLWLTEDDRLIFANPIADEGSSFTDYVAHDGSLIPGSITFEDVTFDGYKDIVLLYSAGAYNFTYLYFAYDPYTESFESKPLLEATNPDFDREAKTITSYTKGRGIGDIFVTTTYAYEDGAYFPMREISQDFLGEWDTEKPSYAYIVRERQGGEMVEIERKELSYEEVWGDSIVQ